MKIGIAFDLVPAAPLADGPDDRYEEFDKPGTVDALAEVLRSEGHEVEFLGDGRDFLARVLADPPDFVWNQAEGEGIGRCREARVPAVLEMLGIPCLGSDPLTLAAALDKGVAKTLVAAAGVMVPGGITLPLSEFGRNAAEKLATLAARMPPPWLLKPSCEGSSKGIRARCLVDSVAEALTVARSLAVDYEQSILVEEFISGDELTVGLIGNDSEFELLEAMGIVPTTPNDRFIYSLDIKRVWEDLIVYEVPPRQPGPIMDRLRHSASTAFQALGCRDLARIDFRVRDGIPYFIEANPLPGLAPGWSDLVFLARGHGLDYPDLIRTILETALERVGLGKSSVRKTLS